MGEEPLFPGRPYLLKTGTKTPSAPAVSELKHQVDIESFKPPRREDPPSQRHRPLPTCRSPEPIAFDLYDDNRSTGSFILIDRYTNSTVAAGMIRFGLRRATNIHWQALDLDKHARARPQGPARPCILWFTGLSGAGKSTIANLV